MTYKIPCLLISIVALGACTGPVIMGGDAAVMYVTKPSTPPPADTEHQIPEHESWCYSTMGDVQCYAHAQNVSPDRLINVDPQSRYPLTMQAYHDAVDGHGTAAQPTALVPAETMPVEKAQPASDVRIP